MNKRAYLLLAGFTVAMVALQYRAVNLHVLDRDFLQDRGDAVALHELDTVALRGALLDRNSMPLAISATAYSVWCHPGKLLASGADLAPLAQALSLSTEELTRFLVKRSTRKFVFLKRQMPPEAMQQILALGFAGISVQEESRRYYPSAEVSAALVGFSNVDGHGQEGAERMLEPRLNGDNGRRLVVQDRLGRAVEEVEHSIAAIASKAGEDQRLSIDRWLQYLAYRELKNAVESYDAQGGAIVIMDPKSGELLALSSLPSYNPNNRADLAQHYFRNRATNDTFEPGSTFKPFIIASALEHGYSPDTLVDASSGSFWVDGNLVQDSHDLGVINLATIIKKSSNVGVSKVALSLPADYLWKRLDQLGFGFSTESGFPWESSGVLRNHQTWQRIDQATLSFGYGVSVTLLQLARGYSAFANGGILPPVTLLHNADTSAQAQQIHRRIMQKKTANTVLRMLEGATAPDGTGKRAAVSGYRVAGKTGTVKKIGSQRYDRKRYIALFVGIAPVSDPKFVVAIMIDDPKEKHGFYGGEVAAPAFSRVMRQALRLVDAAPDDPAWPMTRMAVASRSHKQP